MPRRLAPLLLVALLVAPGCGNERNSVNSLEAAPSPKRESLDFPAAGLHVELPANMQVSSSKPPGLFRAALGKSVVSAFAYRRREQLPRNERELRMAARRLERAAEERGAIYRLADSRTTRVAGARAVELVGDQTISGGRLRTRSLHVYEGSAEYVIELLAPLRDFARMDRALFPTIRRTLEVTGEVRPRP